MIIYQVTCISYVELCDDIAGSICSVCKILAYRENLGTWCAKTTVFSPNGQICICILQSPFDLIAKPIGFPLRNACNAKLGFTVEMFTDPIFKLNPVIVINRGSGPRVWDNHIPSASEIWKLVWLWKIDPHDVSAWGSYLSERLEI